MSSSPALEQSPPSSVAPPSPALRVHDYPHFHTSTPNYTKKHHQPPLNVCLPATAPATPPHFGEPSVTPPPRSPGVSVATPASGDGRCHPPDGTSSDKSSETAVGSSTAASTALSRKESYKAQRQHYRKEKKRAASAILHSIEDPTVVVLSDWLKVRGTLKSWTKLWCILKPGLLLLYKSPKAKRSHWVGTVLLTSCQVIERPSKKDGFCFKLYHPLEQSIWAPRGPHNETTRAVVQPLPTAHLIFRAPSQAAGHCWLDGLELALRCSNAMLRCSRSRPEQTVAPDAPATQTNISHEELEKHFNEHVLKLAESETNSRTPLMFVSEYTSNYTSVRTTPKDKSRKRRITKCPHIEVSDDHTTDSSDEKRNGRSLDFLRERDVERNATVSLTPVKSCSANAVKTCRSLTASPMNKRSQMFNCFDLRFLGDKNVREVTRCISPSKIIEDNLMRLIATLPKRRSSTPSVLKTNNSNQTYLYDKASSAGRCDSDFGSYLNVFASGKRSGSSEVLCRTPENIVITRTAPSGGDGSDRSSSSRGDNENSPALRAAMASRCSGKFSLIDYERLPSASFEEVKIERTRDRCDSHLGYVTGTVVANELAGAASDTDSECHGMPEGQTSEDQVTRKRDVLARIENVYVEDPDREIGVAGELVEEVAEENKSLLWFLLKQVRPGMDLSKVVLPTFILEPRSFLDKLSDNYYHADLLAQAQHMDDPYLRFKCVLRWYLSGLYRKPKGLKKPYNPVLGESFRCCWRHPDSQTYTYYIAEQVSHHPPISAFYVSNRKEGFVIEGSLLARSKFYGNSTSAILEGCARIHLLGWGESYVTTAPYAHCKGIVIGTLSMELGGKVHVICQETGYQADIEFKLRSFLGGADQTNAISGRIKKGKETVASVEGYWDGKIDIKDKKTGEESSLLDVAILKEQRLPRFLVKLEQQQECESQRLWMKVSEAILNDDQVAATEQKTIIEEAQRARARNLLSPWVPRLFRRDFTSIPPEGIVDQGWRYNHSNTSSWQPDEVIEYEDDFVITSVRTTVSCPAPEPRLRDLSQRASDTDSHDELARRSKNSARSLKQALFTMDATLRDQSLAIERLTKTVESLHEAQRAAAFRPQNVGRLPTTTHSWDLFGGFVLAMVLQALLNWLFYHKD